MRQVPGRHIPVAITGSTEVEVGPVNLGLGGAGGVERRAGLPVQEHVVAGFWGVEISHGSGGCRGEGSPTGYPERLGCLARGVRRSSELPQLAPHLEGIPRIVLIHQEDGKGGQHQGEQRLSWQG